MGELKIKSNNNNQINWEYALIEPELLNYINLDCLKHISLLSKFIRLKLKPKLFRNIFINGKKFENYIYNGKNNLLWGYFDYEKRFSSKFSLDDLLDYDTDNSDDEELDYDSYKDSKLEPDLQEFRDNFNRFKPYANSFHLRDISNAGFYLFSLLNILERLTILKLEYCTIPLIEFCKLHASMPRLNTIILVCVTLAKLPTEDPTLESIQLPKSLKTLSLLDCEISIDKSLPNPYNFLFDKEDSETFINFKLSPVKIPSLLSFSFGSSSYQDNGLNQFLTKNPQLEFIYFQLTCLDKDKLDYIKNSKNLKKLTFYEVENIEDIEIPVFNTIESLHFKKVDQELYPIIRDLILASPNLNELTFVINASDVLMSTVDRVITDVIYKCINLKALILFIIDNFEESFDLRNLINVESLTINASLSTILDINFQDSISLKLVEFYFNENDEVIDTIKRNYLDIKNWKFKFYKGCIKGYKL